MTGNMGIVAAISTHRRGLFFSLAVVAMVAILLLPQPASLHTPDGVLDLSIKGKASLAVLAFAVVLWASEAVPFPVAGIMAILMLVATGVQSLQKLVEWGFGNTTIMFFLGVLLFSAAISETTLLKRLTTYLLYHLGHRPKIIILVFLIVGALMAAWITEMAVAAMLLPIGVAILKDARVEPLKSNFGKALMIACGWGPVMGGVATPAGCGANPLTIQYLRDLAHVQISFTDWMLLGFPAMLLMIPCAWWVLTKVFPPEPVQLTIATEDFRERLKAFGRLKSNEIATLSIFLLMIVLWVFPSPVIRLSGGRLSFLDLQFVAIGCASLFFLPGIRVVSWKQAQANVSWGGLILIATGLAIGNAIYTSGAAGWLAFLLFSKLGSLHPILMVAAIVLGVSLFKVMFSSNTVTGAIMVPLLIALANTLHLDPLLMAIPAGITSALAFLLVTSSPTIVIPYSAGYFSIWDMLKAGIFMEPLACVCVTASITVMGKLSHIVNW